MTRHEYDEFVQEMTRRNVDPGVLAVFAAGIRVHGGCLVEAFADFRSAIDEAEAAGVDDASLAPLRSLLARVEPRLAKRWERFGARDRRRSGEYEACLARKAARRRERLDALARQAEPTSQRPDEGR